MEQLSIEQLSEIYDNAESRAKLLRLYSLGVFLSGCSIDAKYRVPDGLHTPIVLTKYGDRIAERLRKQGVPFQESRLLCFLEMLGPMPLVDVDATSVDSLERSIHGQIKNLNLRFPFRYGRLLYDKFAGSYVDRKSVLTVRETQDLLAGTPQGVFQVDQLVCGPYGLLRSESSRNLGPTLTVPLQHCADPGCATVHAVSLATDHDAPINEHRSKITKILSREGLRKDTWFKFFDSFADRVNRLNVAIGEPLLFLIGDSLTEPETRGLVRWLLDGTQGKLRETARSVGLNGSAENIASNLNSAGMLQLVMTCSNKQVLAGIDRLVSSGVIKVPPGEVRNAVINRANRFGAYGLVGQLCHLGARVQSKSSTIAPLRMRRLVQKMYDLADDSDRGELAWQLRTRNNEVLDRRLDQHLQEEPPRDVLERLVLARRKNVQAASGYLGIDLGDDDSPIADSKLIDTVLWKLGFPLSTYPDINDDLFKLNDRLVLLLRQVNPGSFEAMLEDLRGLASNYFVKLEEVLRDSLSYTTWALVTDHYGSPDPFTFQEGRDGLPALLKLNEASVDDLPEFQVRYDDQPGLYALCRGFERLSVLLVDLLDKEVDNLRKSSDTPHWAKNEENLQIFPFRHIQAFLDLATDSQEQILGTLRKASKLLTSAEVSDLRNKVQHPRFAVHDLEALSEGLSAVRDVILLLESEGLCRLTYSMSGYEGDETLRERVTLAHPRGYQFTLHLPNSYSWLHLPGSNSSQYLMPVARIAGDNQILRFSRKMDSPFSDMYKGYPIRPSGASRDQVGLPSSSIDD